MTNERRAARPRAHASWVPGRAVRQQRKQEPMVRRWKDDEAAALRSAYKAVTSRDWDEDVKTAAEQNSVRNIKVSGDEWEAIATKVAFKSAKQCLDRFRTEYTSFQVAKGTSTLRTSRVAAGIESRQQQPARFVPDVTPWISDRPFKGMSEKDIALWALGMQ